MLRSSRWYGALRAKVILRLRRVLLPPEVLQDSSHLLTWPEHAYVEPYLLQFGHEIDPSKVTVGNYSSLNGGTRILVGGHHNQDWVSTYPFRITENLPGAYEDGQPFSRGPVTIGCDVWVAYDVVILSGVTIGHGAVIGAGAVVTKDVPPYAVVTGNPGVVRRKRFDDETIDALLRIAWWDWSHNMIVSRVDEICSQNVAAFVSKYDPGRRQLAPIEMP